jgi:carboxymethylenebutenolidase
MTARFGGFMDLLIATKGRMVEFNTESGRGTGYLVSPEKSHGRVLVLHAWWGLNDFFKPFADRLASQGFLALAPDLYDGPVETSVEEAKSLHSKVDNDRIEKVILGAAEHLHSIPQVSGRKMGVVGFSMGAS